MALRHLGDSPRSPSRQLEDELFEALLTPEATAYYAASNPELFAQHRPPHEVYDNLAWLARARGHAATFSGERTEADFVAEIAGGRPALIAGAFTGSGHIVLRIGHTAAGDLICHDPFGDWSSGYRDHDGSARIYERDRVRAVLKDQDRDVKWGLFIGP